MVETKEHSSVETAQEPRRIRSTFPAEQRGSRKFLKSAWSKYLIAGLLILIISSFFLWRYLGSYESTDDAQVDAHLYPVSARINGYVMKVNVGDNEYVKKGQVLVEVDPSDYQLAIDKARADLATAEANAQALNINVPITSINISSQLKSTASDVEGARAGIAVAHQQEVAARAQLEQAEANAIRAQDDLKRYALLVEKKEVSQQIYDRADAEAKAANANVDAARASVSGAQQAIEQAKSRSSQAEAGHQAATTGPQQVESTNARARSAAAEVQQKQATLQQAELNLQYTKIIAPVNGLVNKEVVIGMNIQPGQQLLTIVPLDDVWIVANFKETQLKHIRAGQKVEIVLDSNGRTYKGHVDSIAGATGPVFSLFPPENATGNYIKIVQRVPVKIVLEPGENQDHQLRPGMNVGPKVHIR